MRWVTWLDGTEELVETVEDKVITAPTGSVTSKTIKILNMINNKKDENNNSSK